MSFRNIEGLSNSHHGPIALIGGRNYSSIPLVERWKTIQSVDSAESSPDVRTRAFLFLADELAVNSKLSEQDLLTKNELPLIERKIATGFLGLANVMIAELNVQPIFAKPDAIAELQHQAREAGYSELEDLFPLLMAQWKPSQYALHLASLPAHELALGGRWAEAAAVWNELLNHGVDEPYATISRTFIAPMHLAVGDVESYQRVCQEIMEHADTVENPSTIFFLVLTCCFEENDPELEQRVLDYAKTKLTDSQYPAAPLALGAAYYRAGDLENARVILEKMYLGMRIAALDKRLDAEATNQLNVMTSICAMFLAATYRDIGEIEKTKPILKYIRRLIEKLEFATLPDAIEGRSLRPWTNKFTVKNLKKELAKFDSTAVAPASD